MTTTPPYPEGPVRDEPPPPSRTWPWAPLAVVLAVIALVVAVVALIIRPDAGDAERGPMMGAGPSVSGTVRSPSSGGSPSETTPGATSSAGPRSGTTTFRFQPLWPFGSGAEAAAWQVGGGAGTQPWRLDAARTAVDFAHDFLGYDEIDLATSVAVSGDQAWVGVGSVPPEGITRPAAVVHLARIGVTDSARPWEVVGTRDTLLSLTTPRYGAAVASPLTVGGRITGVDESLHIRVLARDGTVLGEVDGVPAGGQGQPWSVTVPLHSSASGPATVAVSTGGHLLDVERFAITAVMIAP